MGKVARRGVGGALRDRRGSGGDSQGPMALERVRAEPAVAPPTGGEARRGRRAAKSSGPARPGNGYLHTKRRARVKPFCTRTRTRLSKRPCRRQAASPPSCAALLAQGKAASPEAASAPGPFRARAARRSILQAAFRQKKGLRAEWGKKTTRDDKPPARQDCSARNAGKAAGNRSTAASWAAARKRVL